ncbi:uncharacterized protein LOC143216031 [Lasioglossum baleicum]|uniref:uncharacterized protein LOC143216031 n=1 Tax=Lasioglossum baleicum TaxID=434251 RepID=UPI003FCC3628
MRTCESMKRKRINVALILHGPGMLQPMVHWRIFFILSFVILVSSPCSDSRARSPPNIQKIAKTLKSNKDEPSANRIDDGWREGSLLDEENSKKNIYTQELPFVNFTHNDTEDYQLVIHNEETLPHKRIKRGVIHLYNMLVCATGCNPLSYKGYGCYCGFLGSGYVIDGIDR